MNTHSLGTPTPQTYITTSAEQTQQLGRDLAKRVQAPRLVLLVGDLGAGKTTFAKGLIEGLGAARSDDVLSPTFSLIHEYEGNPKVYHIDLYRLDTLPQLDTLGLDDLWAENAVVLIEWGERFTAQLPGPRLEIRLEDRGGDERLISVVEPTI
ncbi:MAG: tRNA (adenosine(37)-N6)-threonylcarbamoyltransferase complex ATPase subunit type 1 TsaE [Bryobacterales bacterium]